MQYRGELRERRVEMQVEITMLPQGTGGRCRNTREQPRESKDSVAIHVRTTLKLSVTQSYDYLSSQGVCSQLMKKYVSSGVVLK